MKANQQTSHIYDKLTVLILHKICFQRIEKRSGCTSHFNYLICNKILELFRTNLASRLIHHMLHLFVPKPWTCFQRIEKRSGCTSHFCYLICNKILELFRTNLASRLIHHMLYLFVPKSWTNPNINCWWSHIFLLLF